MNPIKVLTRLRPKMLGKIFLIGLRNPWFVLPTFKATQQSMKISTEHYGRKHHKNGPANAFRHALWNFIIAKKCQRWSNDQTKILAWTKQITDWHEEAFPNSELAKAMDLHNNHVGRNLFEMYSDKTITGIVNHIKEMASNSTFIQSKSDLSTLKNQLAHITKLS
nr:hypothetical protein [Allomuricauda sp.]